MSVCEKSDLPVEMCSHCRGLDEKPAPVSLTIISQTSARHAGRCGVCDRWTINPGDLIARVREDDDRAVWAGPCCVPLQEVFGG